MIIDVLNPVVCRVSAKDFRFIKPCLTCKAEYYRKEKIPGTERIRQVRYEYDKTFYIEKEGGYYFFYAGHLERVIEYLDSFYHELPDINYKDNRISANHKLKRSFELDGITFRPDQLKLMKDATIDETGIILSPTGSGKTILQLGLMSAYPAEKILLLSHTVGITSQTFEELQKFGFTDIQQIGGGVKFTGKFGRIVISTIQSFSKIDPELCMDYFDIIMVDEAHRVSSTKNTYAEILTCLMAPIRWGFTATLPTSELAQMSLEGLIGPVIGELTIGEASELGILAEPKVKLLKSNFSHQIKETRKYADVYQVGIIKNDSRNKMIADTILTHEEQGDVSLIFVNRIEHGLELQNKFDLVGKDVPFVRGDMKPKERQNIRHSLMERRRKIAIATTAWREGINIPSLNVIFNAGGGKDELGVLQLIGRGLRRTDNKETVIIYDIFDPSHYFLISHFGERITLYMEKKWI